MSLVQHAVEHGELIEYFWKLDHNGKRVRKVGMMVGFVTDDRLCIGASKCHQYNNYFDDGDKWDADKAYLIAQGRAFKARSAYKPHPDSPYAQKLESFVKRCEAFFKLEYKGEKPCLKPQASL